MRSVPKGERSRQTMCNSLWKVVVDHRQLFGDAQNVCSVCDLLARCLGEFVTRLQTNRRGASVIGLDASRKKSRWENRVLECLSICLLLVFYSVHISSSFLSIFPKLHQSFPSSFSSSCPHSTLAKWSVPLPSPVLARFEMNPRGLTWIVSPRRPHSKASAPSPLSSTEFWSSESRPRQELPVVSSCPRAASRN